MRANKVHNEIKTGKITPLAREPCEMCRGEMRSSLGVVKLGILHLRLSRGLDARGCRLLRRRTVMPWWRRGSYATRAATQRRYSTPPFILTCFIDFLCVGLCSRLISPVQATWQYCGRWMPSRHVKSVDHVDSGPRDHHPSTCV